MKAIAGLAIGWKTMTLMTAAEALAILETRLPPGSLNAVKETVFVHSWEGMAYGAIAEAAGYDADYIRESGSSLWRAISELLHEKVTKRNFRALLLQRLARPTAASQKLSITPAELSTPTPMTAGEANSVRRECDWGEAPDVSRFYGRQAELAWLEERWSEGSPCRLVAILGLGGLGKTALSVKAAQQCQGAFEFVLWRSLRNAPPLPQLLNEILAFFSDQAMLEGNLRDLLTYLRQHRCLLVLDNAETLMRPGQPMTYQEGFEDYGHFFRVWAETSHRSCLVMTSQDRPPNIVAGAEAEILQLQGEATLALALLQEYGLQGSEAEAETLCHAYGNSPLAIKLVAASIQSLFEGNISEFLAEDVVAFDGLNRLLAKHLARLSHEEYTVLTWLAINRIETKLRDLHGEMVPVIPKSRLLALLQSLAERSLLEVRGNRYTLQPVVMDYVLEQLVDQLFREIGQAELEQWLRSDLLHPDFEGPLPRIYTHALLKTTAQEHVRHSQLQSIFRPLTQRLNQVLRSPERQFQYLQGIFDLMRQSGIAASGYICANLLDLSLFAQLDISGLNCAQLTFRQADLRQARLSQVDFTGAEFLDCTFTQAFGTLFSVDYAPDGSVVATGDSQGKIYLWHPEYLQLLATCQGHRGRIHSLCFSPDGQLLASGADDGQVRLWNTETWDCLAVLVGHERFVWSLAWNPDGTLLASGGGDRTVRLWDVETCDCLKVLESSSSWIRTVAFSPDGTLLATGSEDCAVRLWDIPSGQYLGALLGHERWVCTLAFSPEGRWLASGSHDRTVRLWDPDSGDCLQVLRGHAGLVRSVVFHPHDAKLLTTSSDQTLRLWDLDTFHCLRILTGHVGWVQDAAFSPDGETLVSGGHDQTLRRWEVESGICLDLRRGHAPSVRTVDWNPEGTALATCGSDHSVRIWNPQTGDSRVLPEGDQSGLWIGVWSPDGCLLATGSKDQVVRLWDAQTGLLKKQLQGHTCWVCSLRFSPGGDRLVSASSDTTLRIWDLETSQCLRRLEGHSGRVCTVDFSPDGQWLATGGADHSIRLWQADSGDYLRPFQGHQDLVTTVRFSPDGRWLASGSLDKTIKLWDAATGQCLKTLDVMSSVMGLSWNPVNPTQLATGCIGGEVQIWTVGERLAQKQAAPEGAHHEQDGEWGFQALVGHEKAVWDVAFSPDGDRLASCSEDGSTRIWLVSSAQEVQTLVAQGPYAQMKIRDVRGLSLAQIETLQYLGAQLD